MYKFSYIIAIQTDVFGHGAVICQLIQIECIVGGLNSKCLVFKVLSETPQPAEFLWEVPKTQNIFHGEILEQPRESHIETVKIMYPIILIFSDDMFTILF